MKLPKAFRNVLAAAALSFASLHASAAVLFTHDFTAAVTDGFVFKFLDAFNITTPGTYTANLHNVTDGLGANWNFLGMSVVQSGGAAKGAITGDSTFLDGSFNFGVTASELASGGNAFKVLLAYRAGDPGSAGTLSVVGPIPEPEIWALMMVGAGLVGFQVRRKRKASEANRLALA